MCFGFRVKCQKLNFNFLDFAAGLSLSVHATEYLKKKFIEIG